MTYFQALPGEVIPAAQMNAAINQGVIPFASAAARSAAITAPHKGMHTYLQDTGRIEVWNGSAWKPPGPEIAGNSSSGTISGSGGVTIPFGRTFSQAPVVVAVPGDESPATLGFIIPVYTSITTTSFQARCVSRTGTVLTSGTIRVNWLAFVPSTFALLVPSIDLPTAPEPEPK